MNIYEICLRMPDGSSMDVRVFAETQVDAVDMVMDAQGPLWTPLEGKTPRQADCKFHSSTLIADTSAAKILAWQHYPRVM